MLKRTDAVPLEPYDIISDPKTVVALSLLYNSMVSIFPLALRLVQFTHISISNGSVATSQRSAKSTRHTIQTQHHRLPMADHLVGGLCTGP